MKWYDGWHHDEESRQQARSHAWLIMMIPMDFEGSGQWWSKSMVPNQKHIIKGSMELCSLKGQVSHLMYCHNVHGAASNMVDIIDQWWLYMHCKSAYCMVALCIVSNAHEQQLMVNGHHTWASIHLSWECMISNSWMCAYISDLVAHCDMEYLEMRCCKMLTHHCSWAYAWWTCLVHI